MNPYKDIEESFTSSVHVTYEDIATKLLTDRFLLTALELHTELVESGKELPQLREFFSNPGNFEQHVSRAEFGSIHRAPSLATLDSLDTARYSEDGGGDRVGSGSDVAVLEFELRKAKETINSLRANLTQFADGESGLEKRSRDNLIDFGALKPHEKRALNFLINEYLLLQDYKLTSITFSDENPDQDFEDWDDVGLNMPRPSGLVSLFKDGNKSLVQTVDQGMQTDQYNSDGQCQTDTDDAMEHESHWTHELLIQAEEIELLKQKVTALETEKLHYQKQYDAAILSLNSLATPSSESKPLDLQMPENKRPLDLQMSDDKRPLPCTAAENHYGSSNSTHSNTPEQFEIIESDAGGNTRVVTQRNSLTSLDTPATVVEEDSHPDRSLPPSLRHWLFGSCESDDSSTLDGDPLSELMSGDNPVTLPGLLSLAAEVLPKVFASLWAGRYRREAVALTAYSAALLPRSHPSVPRHVNALLATPRKVDADTTLLCQAMRLIASRGGSAEVLSCAAEALASRSIERRSLAAHVCVCVAPLVPPQLATSLLLSLTQLMCECNEPNIRSMGIKAACLICPVGEQKYSQLKSIAFRLLADPVQSNVEDAVCFLIPVLARTAIVTGKFTSDLYVNVIENLKKATTNYEPRTIILYINILRTLTIATLAYISNAQAVKQYYKFLGDNGVSLQEVSLSEKDSVQIDVKWYVSEEDGYDSVTAMNRYLEDTPDGGWTELIWFRDLLRQIIKIIIYSKSLSNHQVYEQYIDLFSTYVDNSAPNFSNYVIGEALCYEIEQLKSSMEKLNGINVDKMTLVGIYLVAVLPVIEDEEKCGQFLLKWIMYSSLQGLPSTIFSVPLSWANRHKGDQFLTFLQHIKRLADNAESASGTTHVRAYIGEILTETEITVAGYEEQLLLIVSSLMHDEDRTVRESGLSAWCRVTISCASLTSANDTSCWDVLETYLNTYAHVLSNREVAKVADALAILLVPNSEGSICEDGVKVLCKICGFGSVSADCVASLLPPLQLAAAAPNRRHQADIAVAVRKLEESLQPSQLAQYKSFFDALLHTTSTPSSSVSQSLATPKSSNAAQEVGRRVTQMFQQSKSNINIQNIFKKKT